VVKFFYAKLYVLHVIIGDMKDEEEL